MYLLAPESILKSHMCMLYLVRDESYEGVLSRFTISPLILSHSLTIHMHFSQSYFLSLLEI